MAAVLLLLFVACPAISAYLQPYSTVNGSKCKTLFTSGYGDKQLFYEAASNDNEDLLEIRFMVKSPSDAVIYLSPSPSPKQDDPVYEVVLGADENSFSTIRRLNTHLTCMKVFHSDKDVISFTEIKGFWIRVTRDGLIQVGREGKDQAFMNCQAPTPLHLEYFGFGSSGKWSAEWFYDCSDHEDEDGNSQHFIHTDSTKLGDCGLENHEKNSEIHFATSYIGKLVNETYKGDVNNANKILSAVSMFDLKYLFIFLSSLYSTMKAHGHLDSYQLIMLAFKVKHAYQDANQNRLDETSINILKNLKDSLPVAVVNFVWSDKRCTLANKKHNDFLFAPWDDIVPSDYEYTIRDVFHDDIISKRFRQYYYWHFEAVNDGEHFKIKNDLYLVYLYASSQLAEGTEGVLRHVFADELREMVDLTEALWKVSPTGNGKYFTLQSSQYEGEFLYANGNTTFEEDDFLRVYTVSSRNSWALESIAEEIDWSFDCSSVL